MSDVLTIGELLAEFMAERVGQTFLEPGVFLGPYPSGAPAIFVSCLAQGFELEKALKLANAAGSLAVTKRGPMEGNSTFLELEQFIATGQKKQAASRKYKFSRNDL